MIRHSIDAHTQPIPAVLEIPSKDHPYDATKDSILRRAKVNNVKYSLLFAHYLLQPKKVDLNDLPKFYYYTIIIVAFSSSMS